MFEQDYILRMTQQLAAALRRVFRLAQSEQLDAAQQALDDAYGDLFGLPPGMLDRVDVATAASLLGHPEKIRAVARLLREEAALLERRGDAPAAAARRARADALERHAG